MTERPSAEKAGKVSKTSGRAVSAKVDIRLASKSATQRSEAVSKTSIRRLPTGCMPGTMTLVENTPKRPAGWISP